MRASASVTWVAAKAENWLLIWAAAVVVRPRIATNAPIPSIVPAMVRADRPGRCRIPASASRARSGTLSRDGPHDAVGDRYGAACVRRHDRVVGDYEDGDAGPVELSEKLKDDAG